MESRKTKLIEKEIRFAVIRGRGLGMEELGEGGQKVQTSSYKVNTSRGCNVQHDDYRLTPLYDRSESC